MEPLIDPAGDEQLFGRATAQLEARQTGARLGRREERLRRLGAAPRVGERVAERLAQMERPRVVLASLAVCACTFAIDACSSDETPVTSEPDASDDVAKDAVFVPEDAEVRCDPDASLLERIEDASISDGASTTGICAACLGEKCSYELAHCAEDCQCQGIVGDALQCYLTTQDIACLGRLTNYLVRQDTRGRALQLSGCARSSCAPQCAIDGGVVSDASVDSPSD